MLLRDLPLFFLALFPAVEGRGEGQGSSAFRVGGEGCGGEKLKFIGCSARVQGHEQGSKGAHWWGRGRERDLI